MLAVGAGLLFGYVLLGATWLVLKTEGALQDWARAKARLALLGVLAGMRAPGVLALARALDRVQHRLVKNIEGSQPGIQRPGPGVLRYMVCHPSR